MQLFINNISVCKTAVQAEHHVVQIHYTGWPDFGVPQDTKTFIRLLEVKLVIIFLLCLPPLCLVLLFSQQIYHISVIFSFINYFLYLIS